MSKKFAMWVSGFCFAFMLYQIIEGNSILVALQAILGFINLMIGLKE